jgi:hypothetical protein
MKIDFGMAFQKASMPGIYGDDVSKSSLAIVGIAIHLLPSTYENIKQYNIPRVGYFTYALAD